MNLSKALSPNNAVFRQQLLSALPKICTERAVIWTRVFQENEALPEILKASKALAATLDEMTILIHDFERIAGNQGSSLRAATLNPSVNTWYLDELDLFERRTSSRFTISPEDKEILREITPYWKGKTAYEKTLALLDPHTRSNMDALMFTCGYTLSKGCGHFLLNMETVLNGGFRSIETAAEKQLQSCDYTDTDGIDKIPFYRAVIEVCQAVRRFALRYAELAEKKSIEASPARKAELLEMARICRKVPYDAPDTFYEALQTVFFIQLITQIESDGTGISLGRLDHLLYPFYVHDIKSGLITKTEAEELLDHLWLKLTSIIQVWNEEDSKAFGGHPISQAITLGGQNENGADDTNELSYMMLETTARVHMAQPSVCCRISPKTPEDFLLLSADVIREGLGMPALYNDSIAVPTLIRHGISEEDARLRWAVIGCVEMGIQGKLCAFANSGYFNLAKALEIFLHGGYDPASGTLLTSEELHIEKLNTYPAFEAQFFRCLRELVAHQVRVTNIIDTLQAKTAPLPFVSAITDGCIQNGKEVLSGGATYNYDGIQGCGFADTVDSLYTLQQLVFSEKKLNLKEFVQILDHNYEDAAKLLSSIRKKLPKYGNHRFEVDGIANRLADCFSRAVSCFSNTRGGFFVAGMYSNSANVPLGAAVGALPNGRLAHQPVAEACSPSHGAETDGPTQAALSVASIDHAAFMNGTQYNQKYHPSALAGKKGLVSLANLVKTFFSAGGYHIQFNVVSGETLRAAQQNPNAYKDLVVRVAGYTAFFIDLSKEIQDDIISRTELAS